MSLWSKRLHRPPQRLQVIAYSIGYLPQPNGSPYAEDTTCLCHQKWRNKAGTQLEASDIIIIALKSTIFVTGGEGIHQSKQTMNDENCKRNLLARYTYTTVAQIHERNRSLLLDVRLTP